MYKTAFYSERTNMVDEQEHEWQPSRENGTPTPAT